VLELEPDAFTFDELLDEDACWPCSLLLWRSNSSRESRCAPQMRQSNSCVCAMEPPCSWDRRRYGPRTCGSIATAASNSLQAVRRVSGRA